MKKRNLVLSVFSLLAIGTIAVGASSGAFRGLGDMLLADGTTTVWRHYPKREATPTEKGIREYWVSCQTHEVTFVEPTSGSIEDMTVYDTEEFTADDARWIYTAALPAQEVLMTAATKSLDLGAFAGGVISSIKSGEYSFGTDASALDVSPLADKATHGVKTVEIETTKNNKLYVLSCETTFVTAEVSTVADFEQSILPQKDTNKFGYYKLMSNINVQGTITKMSDNWHTTNSVRNNYFGGTLDGNGKTITAKSSAISGVFAYLHGATIKNLIINDGWYNGDKNCSILANKTYGTTLNNVTINITGASEAMQSGGFPKCHAPIDGEGAVGYLSSTTFQGNTLKDCTFNCAGYNMGSLFGWGRNMTQPTVVNCKIIAASLVQAMCSLYTKKTYQPKGRVTDPVNEVELTGLTLEIA